MTEVHDFGATLRRLRTEAGYSLRQLGKEIFLSAAQISRVEHGLEAPTAALAAACDQKFDTSGVLIQLLSDQLFDPDPKLEVPLPTAILIGRSNHLAQLQRHLKSMPNEVAGAPRVVILHGMPGVGKTEIAFALAQRAHADFAEAVYLDLGVTELEPSTASPDEAVHHLLRRLGVRGSDIPRHFSERTALLRGKLAGRRILLIIDNVSSPEQVLPFLPHTSKSAVIVISRNQLTALGATFRLQVNPLSNDDAVALFASLAGPISPQDADSDRLTRITASCEGLPLAIRPLAARFRQDPSRSLADFEDEILRNQARLHHLDDGNHTFESVFAAAVDALSSPQLRALSYLAIHPGAVIDIDSCAILTGDAFPSLQATLNGLTEASILDRTGPRTFHLHRVFRDFLRQRQSAVLTGDDIARARRDLVDFYLRSAANADFHISMNRFQITLSVSSNRRIGKGFAGQPEAMNWMREQTHNFVALIQDMDANGFHDACWQFAYYLRGYFWVSKDWTVWIDSCRAALSGARKVSDHRRGEAITLSNLGLAHSEVGDIHEAAACHNEAARAYAADQDTHGSVNTVHNLAWLEYYRGNHHEALRGSRTALDFYRESGSPSNAAIAHDCYARALLALGRHRTAVREFAQVVEEFDHCKFPDVDCAQVLIHYGRALIRLGEHERATQLLYQARDAARRAGSFYEEAAALEELGAAASALGHDSEAAQLRSSAQALYETIGAPDAARLRLFRVGATSPRSRLIPVTLEESDPNPPRVLVLNDEWFSRMGGLSTFNRQLCIALAEAGARVFCYVRDATAAERRSAADVDVTLLSSQNSAPGVDPLTKRPELPGGQEPDIVIGHGRVTGGIARQLVEDHYPHAKRFQFVHVYPDHLEFEKVGDRDHAAVAEQHTVLELDLAASADQAVAIGPLIYDWLNRDLERENGKPAPLRIDPGFDALDPTRQRYSQGLWMRVLMAGRLDTEQERVKGLDLAARALGFVLELQDPDDPEIEFVVRGIREGTGAAVRQRIRDWSAHDNLQVVPKIYSPSIETLHTDLRKAALLVMPSRSEGFGLIGVEAIVAGTPVLVSRSSGLGIMLCKTLKPELARQVTVPITESVEKDRLRWGHEIALVVRNIDAAFRNADRIRGILSDEKPWSASAEVLLQAMRAR
ncbi:NB-ARC domain-containing protein [Nocardia asiatica]|uniref:NB-ARC domain-containing protein n=1 Tax=Nocardia asiatica TaxID=209252 RepID=UPI003EE2BAF5